MSILSVYRQVIQKEILINHYDRPCYSKARGWYYSGYGRALYKLRGTVIEGIFGQVITYHGMARSKFRGLIKVEIQFLMTACASNLKKMVRILDVSEIKDRIANEFTDFVQKVKDVLWNLIKKEVAQVP